MIPWEHLDTAPMPGGGTLKLKRRGDEFSIWLDRIELMNSRLSGSEEAMATLALSRLANVQTPRILIGGLGMGFTLRATLEAHEGDAKIVVAELAPAVIGWAKNEMADLFGECLTDPRVTLHQGDVGHSLRDSKSTYDIILLDVDNGPEGLTRTENDAIYSDAGIADARNALTPGGVLAVWSSAPHAEFDRRMKRSGLKVEDVRVKAHAGRKGARHVIWFGVRG